MRYKVVLSQNYASVAEAVVNTDSEQEAILEFRRIFGYPGHDETYDPDFVEVISVQEMVTLAFDDEVCTEDIYDEFDSLFPGKRQLGNCFVDLTKQEFAELKRAMPDWEDYFIRQ